MKQIPEEYKSAYTSISSLGEFRLIDHLTKNIPAKRSETIKAIGDDAAVVDLGNGDVEVISTDLLVENVHFDLSYVPLRHLGYKSVVVNISDIVAMNAEPIGITISLAVSSRFSVEALDELYAGIQLACEKYNVDLLGGDTSSINQGMVISVSAIGKGKKDEIVYRNNAKAKDLICVTGDLGAAYAGFLVLDREKAVFLKTPDIQPDLSDYDYAISRQLKPEARLDVIREMKANGVKPNSMIDISDGLASELYHICTQSKKGCNIYANKLPIDWQVGKVAEEFEIGINTFALNGGEDYELLFTVPIEDFQKVKDMKDVHIIGNISEDEHVLQVLLDSGQSVELEAQGWSHFSRP
ncbi:MAG: thiamine-phosphate kinase [Bacteroidia bacterium]|nr:thiamine-phosphate kinase [Bacteroidia bacterium]